MGLSRSILRDYLEYRDVKAAGTAGGTVAAMAWVTRDLNTEAVDTGALGALAANQITLQPGTYEFEVSAPGSACAYHRVRLQNITDATTVDSGTTEHSNGTNPSTTRSTATGRFTITAAKVFEVQWYCTFSTAGNMGFAMNIAGQSELYTIARFWRVG